MSLAALAGTLASLLVSQASVSSLAWSPAAYLVRGFPVPYLTFNACDFSICSFGGNLFRPLPSFYPLYAIADYLIWFGIAFGVSFLLPLLLNNRWRFTVSSAIGFTSGLGITLLTLLLQPLLLVTPVGGLESEISYAGGFPWEYLTAGSIALPSFTSPPRVSLFLLPSNFLADYLLWSLASLAVIGMVLKLGLWKNPRTTFKALVQRAPIE